MDRSGLVPIGRITKTHGVRGAVKIYPYGDTLCELEPGEKLVCLDCEEGSELWLTVIDLRAQKRVCIAEFEEIQGMDEAERFAGHELFIPQDRLPALPEGEYYHFQLIGLSVVTRDGVRLGTLKGVIETGGTDVYAVDCDGRELLIPAVEDVVCEVDLSGGTMVVDLPEGLE